MKFNLTVVGATPATRNAQVACVHDDGTQAFTFVLNAASCRNIAKVLTEAADKMDSIIALPTVAPQCPACAGLNSAYDKKRVRYPNGLWMHGSAVGLGFPFKCLTQDTSA